MISSSLCLDQTPKKLTVLIYLTSSAGSLALHPMHLSNFVLFLLRVSAAQEKLEYHPKDPCLTAGMLHTFANCTDLLAVISMS